MHVLIYNFLSISTHHDADAVVYLAREEVVFDSDIYLSRNLVSISRALLHRGRLTCMTFSSTNKNLT